MTLVSQGSLILRRGIDKLCGGSQLLTNRDDWQYDATLVTLEVCTIEPCASIIMRIDNDI
jgi:hypothetical protein